MTPARGLERADALVVGAGPAGLATAVALREGGAGRVVVLDREDEAGGTPRLCDHTGFGLRDLHRVLRGPAYARRWVERAADAGVQIRTRSMVTGWAGPRRAAVTAPEGSFVLEARTVVLATGARERPRAARLVPGTRPPGVFTTGQLQQWVHRQHLPLRGRALIVGAEHVSYSAVLTLREAGAEPVALVTDLPHMQTFRAFDLATRLGLRVPVWTDTTVAAITGHSNVDGVVLRDGGGAERTVGVDVVVFSGDFVPDSELARLAGLTMDPGTRGPASDTTGATSTPGVFSAGNVVHPAETADVAAQRAGAVGRAAAAWLRSGGGGGGGGGTASGGAPSVALRVDDPLLWAVPNLLHPGQDGEGRMLLRTRRFLDHPHIVVTQSGRQLAAHRLRRLVPNRSHALPADWLGSVQPGAAVHLSVS